MKTFHFIIAAIVVALFFPFNFANAGDVRQTAPQSDGEIVPLVVVLGDHYSERPVGRGQTYVPIVAYYDGFSHSIYVSFTEDLGDVAVTVENFITGEYVTSTIDGYEEVAVIPLSGDSGHYEVNFILLSGTVYYSEFEI
ncbi:MAG: hypothetical protein ACOXZI_01970 [Candidatus Cryptobacteroides sp.]|jgi:hypothetical protein|nr:DUF3244 domain-containing protein [Rikenellaceae bacterium]